ncbi:hypothetical protein DFH27DRAFT_542798 [Peziza echinospora]|nr:hypothetical protein DFH27DRAFT_542798 [Peziza echinospora]
MPSEFYPSPDSPQESAPGTDPALARRHVREHASVTPPPEDPSNLNNNQPVPMPAAESASDTLGARMSHVFEAQPSQNHSASPSTVGSVAVERQNIREGIGMFKTHGGKQRMRGIMRFLGNEGHRHSEPNSGADVQEENTSQHIMFSETPHRQGASFTSCSSSGELISIASRKTPYPSPILLGELISKQAKEETDGSYDDDASDEKGKKSVRLVRNSQSSSASSSQSAISDAVQPTAASPNLHTRPIMARKLRKAIRRLFGKAKKKSSLDRLSASSGTTSSLPLTPTRTDTVPTLPQGGRQELSINKQLPRLFTGAGPQRDFLPSEATFVPTPMNTPIIGGPLYFDEALSNIQVPASSTSEFGRPAVIEEEASTTVILTRPLLTQEANVVAPFIKMGENFPAPPTPPIKRKDSFNNDVSEKLPKLDSHGLLGKDEEDSFGHKKKGSKLLSAANLKAFFVKPFVKRDRRDLVVAVSNERDKETAGVGMATFKPPKRRASFAANIPKREVKSGTPNIRRTSTSAIEERRAVYEYVGMGKMPSTTQSATPMEHVQEEDVSLADKSNVNATQPGDTPEEDDVDESRASRGNRSRTPPLQNIYPPLSPSPPPPIERPASTIPTTVKHETITREIEPRPNLPRLMMIPLPLLPPRGPHDDSPPTPHPSSASASASFSGPASLVTIRSDTRKPYVYHSSPETVTLQPLRSPEVSSPSDSSKPSAKSRSSSLSWESGKTTLGIGETEERKAETFDAASTTAQVIDVIGEETERWEEVVSGDTGSPSVVDGEVNTKAKPL